LIARNAEKLQQHQKNQSVSQIQPLKNMLGLYAL
jgi:hypothetical protein